MLLNNITAIKRELFYFGLKSNFLSIGFKKALLA